jgi:hypothetical protein
MRLEELEDELDKSKRIREILVAAQMSLNMVEENGQYRSNWINA